MERYRQEMNEIHAPRKLIDSTKQKCHEAAFSQTTELKRKKRKAQVWIPAVCAAAVLLAVLPVMITRYASSETEYDNTRLHLGQQENGEPEKEEGMIIKRTAIIPMQFSRGDIEKEKIAGIESYLAVSEKGYYSACIPVEEEYIVIDSQMKDKEAFLEAAEKIITE